MTTGGDQLMVSTAVHSAFGEVVAATVATVPASGGPVADQHDTAVLPEHRRQGLLDGSRLNKPPCCLTLLVDDLGGRDADGQPALGRVSRLSSTPASTCSRRCRSPRWRPSRTPSALITGQDTIDPVPGSTVPASANGGPARRRHPGDDAGVGRPWRVLGCVPGASPADVVLFNGPGVRRAAGAGRVVGGGPLADVPADGRHRGERVVVAVSDGVGSDAVVPGRGGPHARSSACACAGPGPGRGGRTLAEPGRLVVQLGVDYQEVELAPTSPMPCSRSPGPRVPASSCWGVPPGAGWLRLRSG